MRLTILSFFRDSAGIQVHRFIKQAALLKNYWPGPLRIVAVYGDCVDATKQQLQAEAEAFNLALHLVEYNTNQPRYGSTEQPERLAALSGLANHGLDAVSALFENAVPEQVLYVESDLLWDPGTIISLATTLDNTDADAVAPLIFAGTAFYDIWGHRGLDGQRFSPFEPYHESLVRVSESNNPDTINGVPVSSFHSAHLALTEVSSVGSCFVMEKWVAQQARMRNGGALVDFWSDARSRGLRVFVDPAEKVRHPA